MGLWMYSSVFLHLGRWRWVVSFTPFPLYSQGKTPWYSLERLCGSQTQSGRCGEEQICIPVWESNPDFPIHSLFLSRSCATGHTSQHVSHPLSSGEASTLSQLLARIMPSSKCLVTFLCRTDSDAQWYRSDEVVQLLRRLRLVSVQLAAFDSMHSAWINISTGIQSRWRCLSVRTS
jgi:hypothetical protein